MKECKKKKQNQQGITLIALVVTIVILLILAATSIAMLTGDDGIITNAQKAQVANKEGEIIDKMGLAYSTVRTEAMVKMSTDPGYQPIEHIEELANIAAKEIGLANAEKVEVPETVNDGYHVYYQDGGATITMLYGDNRFSLKAGSNVENNLYPNIKGVISLSTSQVLYSKLPTPAEDGSPQEEKYSLDTEISIDGKKVSVPAGFTISKAEGETNVDNGLVAYVIPDDVTIDWKNVQEVENAKKTYDQFVWIPVENAILDLSNNTEALSSDDNVKKAVQNEINARRYPMAIKISANKDGKNNYIGILYDFNLDNITKEVKISPMIKKLTIKHGHL